MTGSKRGQKLAEVRAKLDAELERISPRAKVVARTSPTREAPWPAASHRATWRDQVLQLVTDEPGISMYGITNTLDIMSNTCLSTLYGLGDDGLVQELAGGWYPMVGKPPETEPESDDKDKGGE